MTNTILLLLLSLLIASGLSFFQYYFKAKNKSRVTLFLAFLRFLSLFGILVLLINPIISRKTFEIIKTPLVIAVDNSSSIIDLKANQLTLNLYDKLSSNSALQEKFDIQSYRFGSEFESATKFDFKEKQTNIESIAKNLKSIHRNVTFPTILITDGNQTTGNDYVYSFESNHTVYPLVVGDTTSYLDLRINQLNVNKYAFHKNKFPVEVFINYSGTKNTTANLSILLGKTILNTQKVTFSPSKKSATVKVLLPADKVGLQVYKAVIQSKEKEKNTINNTKNFAVEIIDQRTNIAIISSIKHPDLGVLKRAIEVNAQRKVTIVKPNEVKSLRDYSIVLLYQPNSEFKAIFDSNKLLGINTFIITGTHTDFSFLNQQQNSLVFKMTGQKEDYLAAFNPQFNLFQTENISFEQFPPLENTFGTVKTNASVSVLLWSKIRNLDTNSPLLAFAESQGTRSAFLLGENLWKWRLQSHVETKSFQSFDLFMDKTIQFLASSSTKKALVVNHDSYYNSGDELSISAQYFNKNYEFDEKARLTIALTNRSTKQTKKYDFLKTNSNFKVNLEGLSAGQYNFTVKELNSNTTYTGFFEVLNFDIEKQFVNPDVNKLNQLALQTQGKLYYPNQVNELIKTLQSEENYKPIQKEVIKKTPFIDWIWVLILIVVSLASEWFIRKYNGML